MRQIIYIKVFALLLLAGCFAACNEDKGNYTYTDINKVDSISNINDSYFIEMGATLLISPKVVTSQDNADDFDYTWYYNNGDKGWVEFAKGKELSQEISDPFGQSDKTYNCAFEALNKQTGIAYRKLFAIQVSGVFTRGYVALCEKQEGIDLDMVILKTNDTFQPYHNIFATMDQTLVPPYKGVNPYDILIFKDPTGPNPVSTDGSNRSIYLLTDQYTTRLKFVDFTWDESYDISNAVERNSTLYNSTIAQGKKIVAQKMNVGWIATGQGQYPHIYFYMQNGAGGGDWWLYNTFPFWQSFSEPMNGIRSTDDDSGNADGIQTGTRYEAAPFLAMSNISNKNGTTFYNTEDGKFYYQTISSSSFSTKSLFYTEKVNDTSTDGVFNFSDGGQGIVYMGTRQLNGYASTSIAILKQTDGSFKYIEYLADTNTGNLVRSSNKKRSSILPANCGIDQAKFVVAPPTGTTDAPGLYIYYVTPDNKIHYADISSGTAVLGELSIPDLTADGYNEITLFKAMLPSTSGLHNSFSKTLAIATYNSSLGKDTGGKLSIYSIPKETQPDLELAMYPTQDDLDDNPGKYGVDKPQPMSWTGLGQIVGLDYKN
ncbi:MAG: hypothetical protein LBN24_12450 [Mediterranea sp.]|jgi:hypothetical protein|nr:hypothetical protein [Mediterranea sp.]